LAYDRKYEAGRDSGWATARRLALVCLAMAVAAATAPGALRLPLGTGRSRPDRPSRSFVAALRRRERDALETVYAEYAPTVLGYLVNTVGNRSTAEDVHQQVFLEVWQRAPSYDPQRGGVLTWIMNIARSRAVDELRRRRPEPRDPSYLGREAADPDPDASPEALVERWRVAHMLSRLRPEDAGLLRQRFYEGLSQSEISERTGMPLGTVKTRMTAALGVLRELVDAEEEGP
jgi:RNA polymerase sigma-70 factor (ECF subfamily)